MSETEDKAVVGGKDVEELKESEVKIEETSKTEGSTVVEEQNGKELEEGEVKNEESSKVDGKEDSNQAKTNKEDLYAYLERDDHTTEKYKIEIRGLPRFYGIGELKRFLNEKLQLNASKIKPPKRGSAWAYVCFHNEEDRERAIRTINGVEWKKGKLSAQAANPAPDPFMKRKLEMQNDFNNKRAKATDEDESLSPEDKIKKTTIPLWDMPYEEQLELKQKEMRKVMHKIEEQISKVNKEVGEWMKKQKDKYDGLPCELGKIIHTDVTEGYRNKCEFTIGLDVTGKKKMIGFRLSSYAAGSISVGPIDHLCHIPQRMKTAVKVLEKFVCESELDTFDPVTHKGHWKQVTARTTSLNDLMLIVAINPQGMSDEDQKKLQDQLKEFFDKEENIEADVSSLYFQTIEKKGTGGEGGGKTVHLSGTPYIEETILNMKFRISPLAFFQINSFGAEKLYKTAIDLANPSTDTALLDVCCGTGTIGICFAKHCDEVFGIELVPNAIHDAKKNAEINNVTNCEFFAGKAEDILQPVINRITKSNIIAIVDPPRAGLHQKALVSLRKAKRLQKLVYISCDPNAAIKNLVDLARPNSKQYFNEPLVPVKAVPVDMFPYTRHCELVLYLERFSLLKESSSET